MIALAGALGLATLLVTTLVIDVSRAHGQLVRSLENLDPQPESSTTPLSLTTKPTPFETPTN
ncbi:MAG: hypothetical protein WCK25_00490 [Actinomycetes bacterium]